MAKKKEPDSQDPGKAFDASIKKALESFMPETVKRAMFTGAGMLFMTEEGIKKAMSEVNIPREAIGYVVKQSEKSKKEFYTIFQRELGRFFSRLDVTRLSQEVLDGISLEVNARVTLRMNEEDGTLSLKMGKQRNTGRVKKSREKKESRSK